MDNNPTNSIAIFLGPSLDKSEAQKILDANYYPPAQMGDVYRLIGSGVNLIILIDGLFHGPAAIWPRELAEALHHGITVIGASSMGALRAAELQPLGMIGCGQIFDWYQSGRIEGDDEVALILADEGDLIYPLSEPLVNVRYNLERAAERAIITPTQASDFIEAAKQVFYAERTYTRLWQTETFRQWPTPDQTALRHFIAQQAIDLKRQDAIIALNYGAGLRKDSTQPKAVTHSYYNPYYQWVSYQQRGFRGSNGREVTGKTLLAALAKDEAWWGSIHPPLVKQFFLWQWAKQNDLIYPEDEIVLFQQAWQGMYIKGDCTAWRQKNSLTEIEFTIGLKEQGLLAWMLAQEPDYFGLNFQTLEQIVAILIKQHAAESGPIDSDAWLKQMREIGYLAAWAKSNGVTCPTPEIKAFTTQWETQQQIETRSTWLRENEIDENDYHAFLQDWATSEWLLTKGPIYFGYTTWSVEIALLQMLQLTGRIPEIVDMVPCPPSKTPYDPF